MYILDQELTTLPQTPEDDPAKPQLLIHQNHNQFSSGSSDNLERESHENTPTSPYGNKQFFNKLAAAATVTAHTTANMQSNQFGKFSKSRRHHFLMSFVCFFTYT